MDRHFCKELGAKLYFRNKDFFKLPVFNCSIFCEGLDDEKSSEVVDLLQEFDIGICRYSYFI